MRLKFKRDYDQPIEGSYVVNFWKFMMNKCIGDKFHSTRSKEEIQKSNKVQTDKNNDQIRIMIISEV